MDGKKVFLIVLVLIAAMFAVGVVLVAGRSDDTTSAKSHEPGGLEKAMGRLLGPLKPRAKLSASSFTAGTSTSVARSDDAMRMLKLRINKGCGITMVYERAPHPKASKLDRQSWPDEDARDRESTSFVILEEGGTIAFGKCTTSGHSACRVFVVED